MHISLKSDTGRGKALVEEAHSCDPDQVIDPRCMQVCCALLLEHIVEHVMSSTDERATRMQLCLLIVLRHVDALLAWYMKGLMLKTIRSEWNKN